MGGADFLRLELDTIPLHGRVDWLEARLRGAIADHTLGAGVRLPASRALAEDLSLGRGTVVEAYRRLTEEGLLITNRGGGTAVGELTPALGSLTAAREDRHASREVLDVSAGMPDLTAFPRTAWLRAEKRVLGTASSRELGYADPQGVLASRAALSGWLARSRGVAADPGRIIVTAGVTGALSLLAQGLRDRGIRASAVEDPGADGNRRILDYWLDALHPVPVDHQGLDVAALYRSGARAVLVTPAHQFPRVLCFPRCEGVSSSPGLRRLAAW